MHKQYVHMCTNIHIQVNRETDTMNRKQTDKQTCHASTDNVH